MKILLVSSPVSLQSIENLTRLPNLGLASIAANIEQEGNEVKIADLVACPKKPLSYFRNLLLTFSPDVVGFSAMTFQYNYTVKLAKETRSFNPDIKTVLGGYHATTAFEEILKSDDMQVFDYIVMGEGEQTFKELLAALQNHKDPVNIPGLSFLTEKGDEVNTSFRALADLNDLPLAARNERLLDSGFHFFGEKADIIETSRGCTFGCDYCSINCMYGKNFRKFSLQRVINDIQRIREKGVKFILLADDNITLDPQRLTKLCELIISEKLNDINYVIQTGVKGISADPKLPELMTDAGMKYIFLSLENPGKDGSKFYNVPEFKYDDALKIIADFRKRGAFIMGGFVLGRPDEKEEDLWNTYRFAKKSGVDMVAFLILTPYPGTRVRERLLREGLITNPDDYSEYSNLIANIKTHHLSSDELTDIAKKMNARFLLERGTFFRLLFKFPKHIISRLLIEIFKYPGIFLERLKGIFWKK